MNSPNPALVTRRAAQRLPRVALLLLCASYVLPGLFGRDPWKNADITAFGYMVDIAQGRTGWLAPTVGGLPADAALLPYWLGAIFIRLLGPWIDPTIAARIPFALLLVAALALTWYTSYHLARTEAAQPLPFAFGGEASPIDYARAIADGGVLALIAMLGLLQLGHETTPELGQLASVSLFLYALAASPQGGSLPALAMLVALPALAASGAPSIALALGLVGSVICLRASDAAVRRFVVWVGLATLLAAAVATLLGAWAWRVSGVRFDIGELWSLLRQFAWFCWPGWVLAFWTIWRWRSHLFHRHISIPLGCIVVCMIAWIAMAGFDRALMLALPPFAVLAAFALPTLQRSTSAALDWFSVCFFSLALIGIWFVYISMRTGIPPKPAANIERLAPGYPHQFGLLAFVLALLGTLAWLGLVRWRTGRNQHALWKSLVLPAGGVATCWLLAMTLLLPPLNHARSDRPLVERMAAHLLHLPPGACIAAPGMPRAEVIAFQYMGGFELDATSSAEASRCDFLIRTESPGAAGPGPRWQALLRDKRAPRDDDATVLYRRTEGHR